LDRDEFVNEDTVHWECPAYGHDEMNLGQRIPKSP